ncbi:MAG: FHA domain-containing protein [Pseudomonadota bacterium]|nr:FHA domain-containing protein [Pseudomonadota bacterium]
MSIRKSNALKTRRPQCKAAPLAIAAVWLAFLSLLPTTATVAAGGPLDIVVLLDNSSSMRGHDPDHRVRNLIDDFIGNLPPDSRVGIMLYDRGVVPVRPLSPAGRVTAADLGRFDYSGQLSNAASAMERAIYELTSQGRGGANLGIVLLMDGPIDTGNPEKDFDYSRWLRDILADEAAQAGIRVYGIALSEDADIQIVQTLAHSTNGNYRRAATIDDLDTTLQALATTLGGGGAAIARPGPDTAPMETPPEPVPSPSPSPSPVIESASPAPDVTAPEPRDDRAAPTPPPATTPAGNLPSPAGPSPLTRITEGSERALVWARHNPIPVIVAAALLLAGILTLLLRRRPRKRPRASVPGTPPEQVAFTPPCLLEDLSGASRRQNYDITGKLTWISRAPGDEGGNARTIVIRDDLISRDHAVIEYRNYGYWISDRGSVNGTWVNGERLVEERRLKNGDRIRFAKFEFLCGMPQRDDMDETVMAVTEATASSRAPAQAPEPTAPHQAVRTEGPESPPAKSPVAPRAPAPPARRPLTPGPARPSRPAPVPEKKKAQPKAPEPNLFARTDTQEQPAVETEDQGAYPRTGQIATEPTELEVPVPDPDNGDTAPKTGNADETVFAEALKPTDTDEEETGDQTVVRPGGKD